MKFKFFNRHRVELTGREYSLGWTCYPRWLWGLNKRLTHNPDGYYTDRFLEVGPFRFWYSTLTWRTQGTTR